MNFIDRVIVDDNHFVRLVTGKNGDKEAWWYLLVEPEKERLYQRDMCHNHVNLHDYGTILACGWGKNPPIEVQEAMENYSPDL